MSSKLLTGLLEQFVKNCVINIYYIYIYKLGLVDITNKSQFGSNQEVCCHVRPQEEKVRIGPI